MGKRIIFLIQSFCLGFLGGKLLPFQFMNFFFPTSW
jgi:hypothetical protein